MFFSEIEPFPCAVLAAHWPNVPNLGNMTKIGVDENGIHADDVRVHGGIDLLVGGTPCFVAGTMVLTERGYRPIEEIHPGDYVVTHKRRLRKVLRVGSKEADVLKVKVIGRPTMQVTANHPFWITDAKRDNRRKSPTYAKTIFGDRSFIPIGDAVGKYATILDGSSGGFDVPIPEFPRFYRADRMQIARFFGWYIGDGYIRRFTGKSKKCVILCISEKKLEKFKADFGDSIHYSTGDRVGKSIKVTVSNTEMANFCLEHFGEHSHAKRMPAWCYADAEIAKALVDGYLSTDGCRTKNGVSFLSVSAALAYGISDLLGASSVSISHPVEKRLFMGKRTINQRSFFTIRHENKLHKLFLDKGCVCARITQAEGMSVPQTVFNLEVEEDNTYVAAGVFVHNCQSYSVAGKREGNRGVSGLSLNYIKLAEATHARWVVWENVPGVFSSTNGLDFAAFLSGLCRWDVPVPKDGWKNAGICLGNRGGYGVAWRVLDGQYTRVPGFPRAIPQRRRRVFLVGYRSQPVGDPLDWQRAAAVLFDGESLDGNPPPRRKAQENAAPDTGEGLGGAGGGDAGDGTGRPWDPSGVNPTLNQATKSSGGIGASDQELFSQNGNGLVMAFKYGNSAQARSIGLQDGNSPTINTTGGNSVPVIADVKSNAGGAEPTLVRMREGKAGGGKGPLVSEGVSLTLGCGNDQTLISHDGRREPSEQRVYTVDADASNSMKSGNPNSGFHEAEVAKTLDTGVPTPQKAQGGQMVVRVDADSSVSAPPRQEWTSNDNTCKTSANRDLQACRGGRGGIVGLREGLQADDNRPGDRGEAKEGSEVSGFNFELFSGECKSVSPCIGATRAGDTLVYKDDESKNDKHTNRTVISIGNGQAAEFEAHLEECCQTLNCMHETQKIAIIEKDGVESDGRTETEE